MKKWIEQHRATWMLVLFNIGISLGLLQSALLQTGMRQTVTMCFIYGLLLVIVEIFCGGAGCSE